MASSADITPTPPHQPGLRSFIVYDRVPDGLTMYQVPDDRQRPHLRAGDWAIVDPTDRTPFNGELFVLQYHDGDAKPQVVETGWLAKMNCWAVGARRNAFNGVRREVAWDAGVVVGDFGYSSKALENRILGRVVGIFESGFAEPSRSGGSGGE